MGYIGRYWRKAPGRATRGAWEFVQFRVAWGSAVLVVTVSIAWNVLHLGTIAIWHELWVGLRNMAGGSLLVWLWHLLIVTPARIKRDLALQEKRAKLDQPETALDFEVSLEDLSKLGDLAARDLLTAGIGLGRKYAVLRVANKGGANLTAVVARCVREESIRCAWSDGVQLEGAGVFQADLGAGNEKILIFAQVLEKEGVWARLPKQRPVYEVPVERGYPAGVHFVSEYGGDTLDFDAKSMEMKITFITEGSEVTRYIRLAFDGAKPIATLLPARPYRS
jgi:hypothetical protein